MDDLKKTLENAPSLGGFIKSSDEPILNLSSKDKALLNRKANVFFNEGDYLKAQRIYITTGYSDGLSRIADVYAENNEELQALKFYYLAHNKRAYEPLIEKFAELITRIIKYEE